MISKYRNRAAIQIACAFVLTVLWAFFTYKQVHTPISQRGRGWTALLIIGFFASWVMWMMGSITLTRAKGYQRDFAGGLFVFIYLLGFCFPIAPVLFPLFIIFALEDKAKRRIERR